MSPQIFKSTLLIITFLFLALIPGQAQLCEKVEHMNDGQKTSYGLRVCKVDWNKDGLMDFITGGYAGTKLQIHVQQTDGSYLASSYTSENIPSEHQSLAVGDFDKDGNPDLVVGGMPLTCLLGDGNNSYVIDYIVHPDYKTSLVVGDFDYDGNQDLVATGRTSLSLFWGDGAGHFTEQVIDTFTNVYSYQTISANLQGKEATDIVVSITFENKKGETYTYFNAGDRKFDKVLLNREASRNIFALHLHDNAKTDILAISDQQIKIQTPQSQQKFTENNISLRNKHIHYAFALDLNQNNKNDIVLVDFSGGIYFLINKGDGTFHKSPKLANIQSYPRDVEIFSFENNELKILYNGNKQGIYTIRLPEMASWYPQYKNQHFFVITNDTVRQNVISFLERFFLLKDSHIDLDVFSSQESAYCEPFYGVFVEDTFYKFDANGKMIFSTRYKKNKDTNPTSQLFSSLTI